MENITVVEAEKILKDMGISERDISFIHEIKNKISDDMVRRVTKKDWEYETETKKFLLANDIFRKSCSALTEICEHFTDYANFGFFTLMMEIGLPMCYQSKMELLKEIINDLSKNEALMAANSSVH